MGSVNNNSWPIYNLHLIQIFFFFLGVNYVWADFVGEIVGDSPNFMGENKQNHKLEWWPDHNLHLMQIFFFFFFLEETMHGPILWGRLLVIHLILWEKINKITNLNGDLITIVFSVLLHLYVSAKYVPYESRCNLVLVHLHLHQRIWPHHQSSHLCIYKPGTFLQNSRQSL